MAIIFTSAVRQNPAPCDHFTITVTVDGTPRTFTITSAEAQGFADDPMDLKELWFRWVKYKRSKGATFGSLVGQTMVS